VGKFDWQKISDEAYALFQIDRKKQVVGFNAYTGVWERLAALMGFEKAMVALIEEPEACNELFVAITDYKIRLAEIAVKYFKADTLDLFKNPMVLKQVLQNVPHFAVFYRNLFKN
jgi:hypothetical protein